MCGDSMKKKKQNAFLQIGRCVLLLFIAINFGLFSYYFLQIGLNNKYEKVISYNSSSNVAYKVYLFENDYFEEPYLGMNRTYISSLINYIDIDFNYNLNFSEFVSGKYTYYVKGTIAADKIKENDGSYWSKSYILTEPETITYNDQNSFNISTNVIIDYQKYNNLLNEFKKDYGISFNGVFNVELIVNSESKSDNIAKKIPVESLVEVKIPLTQQVIDLSIDLSNNDTKNSVSETLVNNDSSHYVFLGLSILFFVVTICLIWSFFKEIRLFYLSKSQYSKMLRKILSSYDSIIVNVSNVPSLDDLKIIEVNSFNELIDAHSEVRMPINYCEEVENYKSVFVLVSNNIAWIYTLINHEYEKYLGNGKIGKSLKEKKALNQKKDK